MDDDKMVNIRPSSRVALPRIGFDQVSHVVTIKQKPTGATGMYDLFRHKPVAVVAVLQVGTSHAWVKLPNLMDAGVYYVWSGINASGSLVGKPIDAALPPGLACYARQAAFRCQMDLPVFYSMLRKVCHRVDALFGAYYYCTAFFVIAALALRMNSHHLSLLQASTQLVTVVQTVAGVMSRDSQRLKDAENVGVASSQQVRAMLSSIVLAGSHMGVLHQLAFNAKI